MNEEPRKRWHRYQSQWEYWIDEFLEFLENLGVQTAAGEEIERIRLRNEGRCQVCAELLDDEFHDLEFVGGRSFEQFELVHTECIGE